MDGFPVNRDLVKCLRFPTHEAEIGFPTLWQGIKTSLQQGRQIPLLPYD